MKRERYTLLNKRKMDYFIGEKMNSRQTNKENNEEVVVKKNIQNKIIIVIEKQPDEPAFRTKRIVSQNDVMDWVNGRKKWIDFQLYDENEESDK
jgi:hypothetical protein